MPQLLQDPVAGYWVAISEGRAQRPNEFAKPAAAIPFPSTSNCPFCPEHEQRTPSEVLRYPEGATAWRLRVIPNLYPAITGEEGGVHEVVVDSPLHAGSFGKLPRQAAEDVLLAARDRMQAFKSDQRIQYVQWFKNNGPGSGASMQHPHSQLLALPHIPVQVRLELEGAKRYFASHGRCIFCEMPALAKDTGRTIAENEHAVVMAPHAPRFAFETWIVPRQHGSRFEDAACETIRATGAILHETVRAIENLLDCPPYNLLLHTAPFRHDADTSYHWHIEILPRIAGIGGFEFGTGCYINTVTPENAAAKLRHLLSR